MASLVHDSSSASAFGEMDVKALHRIISDTERGLEEKKASVLQNLEQPSKETSHVVQPTEALKIFFDRIPLHSVPGIRNEGGLCL